MENAMTAKILNFTGYTTEALEPSAVLEAAKEKLEDCLVIGWTKEDEFYLASTTSKAGEILLLIDLAKEYLMRKVLDGDA
jgi:hypothetical protein